MKKILLFSTFLIITLCVGSLASKDIKNPDINIKLAILGSQNIAYGDVDGDGDCDIFAATAEHPSILWLNDGQGNFLQSSNLFPNRESNGVLLNDLNGDGALDAFLVNNGPNRIWLNNGTGIFRQSNQSLGNHNSRSAIGGDIDNDGDIDLLVYNKNRGYQMWINNGSALFTLKASGINSWEEGSMTFLDIHGDQDLDLHISCYLGSSYWYINNGSGEFAPGNLQTKMNSHRQSKGVDLNGDNLPDIATVNKDQTLQVWFNQGDHQYHQKTTSQNLLHFVPVPMVNPGFETGDFTGWITKDMGGPFFPMIVWGPGISPGFGTFISSPTEGGFAALNGFDGDGPDTIELAQEVTLPEGERIILEFDYRAAWDMVPYGATVDRLFQVQVEPVGGGSAMQSTLILTAQFGTMVLDTGNLTGSVELGRFSGMTVRISFEWIIPESFTGPAFFQLDNIRINNRLYVQIVTPLEKARVNGIVPVVANSSTIVGNGVLKLYIDGEKVKGIRGNTITYDWDTTQYAFGPHRVEATASDDSGDSDRDSNDVIVDQLPTVKITKPKEGSNEMNKVTIQAEASDDDTVSKVEFYANDQLVATDTEAPYSTEWNSIALPGGVYTIMAKAYDSYDQTAQHSVNINLQNLILGITASRQQDRAWLIKSYFAQISVSVENGSQVAVYAIQQKGTDGSFNTIKEFTNGDILSGTFDFRPGIQQDQQYTYRVIALDGEGNTILSSKEITI